MLRKKVTDLCDDNNLKHYIINIICDYTKLYDKWICDWIVKIYIVIDTFDHCNLNEYDTSSYVFRIKNFGLNPVESNDE